MSFQILTVLSAVALTATGLGATSETRSAASIPIPNLVLVRAPAGIASKFHSVRRLADTSSDPSAPDQSNERKCKRGNWNAKKRRCPGGWWMDSGSRLLIGAGTLSGLGYAISQNGERSQGGNPISN